MQAEHQKLPNKQSCLTDDLQTTEYAKVKTGSSETINNLFNEDSNESNETILPCNGNDFLKRSTQNPLYLTASFISIAELTNVDLYNSYNRFSSEERSTVSHIFHQWAKKAAFKEPKRLLDKVPAHPYSCLIAFSLLFYFTSGCKMGIRVMGQKGLGCRTSKLLYGSISGRIDLALFVHSFYPFK